MIVPYFHISFIIRVFVSLIHTCWTFPSTVPILKIRALRKRLNERYHFSTYTSTFKFWLVETHLLLSKQKFCVCHSWVLKSLMYINRHTNVRCERGLPWRIIYHNWSFTVEWYLYLCSLYSMYTCWAFILLNSLLSRTQSHYVRCKVLSLAE